jgi:predicted  nucleic acid-binding Zn-ribbon protein
MTDKNAYIEKAKAQIDRWTAEIDKMTAKLAEAEADSKIAYDKQLDEARKQRDDAEAKLKEIGDSSDDAWDDMKAGIDKAWDSMSDAFNRAMSRFK